VNADWNRFNPTNAVNHRKPGCTYMPSSTLATTNAPPINRTIASTFMT